MVLLACLSMPVLESDGALHVQNHANRPEQHPKFLRSKIRHPHNSHSIDVVATRKKKRAMENSTDTYFFFADLWEREMLKDQMGTVRQNEC